MSLKRKNWRKAGAGIAGLIALGTGGAWVFFELIEWGYVLFAGLFTFAVGCVAGYQTGVDTMQKRWARMRSARREYHSYRNP